MVKLRRKCMQFLIPFDVMFSFIGGEAAVSK